MKLLPRTLVNNVQICFTACCWASFSSLFLITYIAVKTTSSLRWGVIPSNQPKHGRKCVSTATAEPKTLFLKSSDRINLISHFFSLLLEEAAVRWEGGDERGEAWRSRRRMIWGFEWGACALIKVLSHFSWWGRSGDEARIGSECSPCGLFIFSPSDFLVPAVCE